VSRRAAEGCSQAGSSALPRGGGQNREDSGEKDRSSGVRHG
jgi:hypothetical protein